MRTIAGFIVFNLIIVAAYTAAAVVILTIMPLVHAVVPDAANQMWPGVFAVIITIAIIMLVFKAVTR